MYTVLTYTVSLFVIVISIFTTLTIKSELERMFREKKGVLAFHICNVVVILTVSLGAYAVMNYFSGKELNLLLQLVILIVIILPMYIMGHFAFEKYKFMNRKYSTAENGKVLIISEKYLNGKKNSKL